MINTLIVENEQSSAESLMGLLRSFCPEVKIEATCDSVTDALALVEKKKIDLVFLDVELNGETGFDFLKSLTDIPFEVIFTTAHNKYAIQAIKSSALDFLLKPIDPKELVAAVDRYQRNRTNKRSQIELLLQNILPSSPRRVAIPSGDELIFQKEDDIVLCTADGNYTRIFTIEGKEFIASKTLGEFEEQLSPLKFFRTHKSYLINIAHLVSFNKAESQVTLANGLKADVAARRKDEFLRHIQKS